MDPEQKNCGVLAYYKSEQDMIDASGKVKEVSALQCVGA